jgi:two-component system NtrC family response regulator
MAKILVIDDDAQVVESILHVARSLGHEGRGEGSLKDGLESLRNESFDLVFLDVQLPDGSGLDILNDVRAAPSAPEAIIITGFGDPDGAELAIRNGAWDYLQKPLSVRSIRLPIERALQYRDKKKSVSPLRAVRREGIIGESPRLRVCLDGLAQAASGDANVMLVGETGTGKELFAWAIHKNSERQNHNFVVVDCAALPETLVESTLFGHIRGAFTGADRPRDGLIMQADQGTLFLDEVGELSPGIQKAFLRVLQEKRFRPVGAGREVGSDFRLIAATNRDLDAMVKAGRFREDLLYRLRTLVIDIPTLRDRREDLKELVLAYTARLCDQYKIGMKGFSPGFWNVLSEYDWPGNVRELIQALEKSILEAMEEPILFTKHLPQHIRIRVARTAIEEKKPGPDEAGLPTGEEEPFGRWERARRNAIGKAEKAYLTELVKRSGGDIQAACRISGLSRARLYALLKKNRIRLRSMIFTAPAGD